MNHPHTMTTRRSVFVSVLLGGLVLVSLSGCSGGNPQMGKAEDAMKQGRFEQALSRVDSALAQDSANVDAYLLKADILRQQADTTMAPDVYKSFYEKARTAEEKALEVGGAEGTVETQRRRAYSTQSQKGTKAFRRARQASDPLLYRQAAAHFGAASATYPDSASVILNEAYALLNQVQNREGRGMVTVIPTLERYLETARAPERNAYDILSALYLQDDQAQKAIDLLESAREDLSQRPTHFRLEGTRGLEYSGTVEEGGTSRSVEGTTPGRVNLDAGSDAVSGTFSKKQKQGQLRVRLFYKGAAVADTTIASGKASLSTNLSEQTPLAELEGRLLNAYNQAGQTEKAMAEYEEQIEKNPNNATYRYNYGSMLLQADRYDEAIEQLQTAVELAPDNVKAHYNLGAAYSNKARQVQNQLTGIEDSLRSISEEAMAENREPTDEERRRVNALDQKKKELREQKKALFEKSIPPLKEASEMSAADGSFRKDACTALVTAYVQTEQLGEAKKYEDCAGLQVGRRSEAD